VPERATACGLLLLVLTGLCVLAGPVYAETGMAAEPYLLGDWGGLRTRLLEQGVRFDLGYVSDTLWGFKSQQTPFAMWNRFRATVDIDFAALAGFDGWYFHATGLAQGGGNLGLDLGLVTGPSSLVSQPAPARTSCLRRQRREQLVQGDRIIPNPGAASVVDRIGE